MKVNELNGNRNASVDVMTPAEESSVPRPPLLSEPVVIEEKLDHSDTESFATRAQLDGKGGIEKSKLIVLGGGLLLAVLFFVFTAVVGKPPAKKNASKEQASHQTQDRAQEKPKGSVTPVMDTVRPSTPDNATGQLGPGDIKRTRSTDGATRTASNVGGGERSSAAKTISSGTLGSVPSFSDTQQKWEEPQPYGGPAPSATPTAQAQQQQSTLKEPSLVFVRSQIQNQVTGAIKEAHSGDDAPVLEITPGMRILAKLQTEISSADPTPVVAVVEYTYAIGDQVVVPAGAQISGQLQHVDRSGYVGVKFDEIELLGGRKEKIDAVGKGLDLGPIRGTVTGKNTGKNFLVRTASGISSVAAMLVGNNTSSFVFRG